MVSCTYHDSNAADSTLIWEMFPLPEEPDSKRIVQGDVQLVIQRLAHTA